MEHLIRWKKRVYHQKPLSSLSMKNFWSHVLYNGSGIDPSSWPSKPIPWLIDSKHKLMPEYTIKNLYIYEAIECHSA